MTFWVQLTIVLLFLIVIGGALGAASLTTIKEIERGAVFTLGRFAGIRQPGLRFILPVIQQLERVDIRERVVDVLPQNIITKDNIRVTVNAVINYRVYDPRRAIVDVEDVVLSTREMAQAVLRNAVQSEDLDNIADPNRLGADIASVLDKRTAGWGVRVTSVEIKEIEVDPAMVRAMAAQAEAERNRRAKIIQSEGEVQAADNLKKAARILAEEPGAMQLRYLNTLAALGNDKTSTIIFPFPTDMKQMLGEKGADLQKLIDSPLAKKLTAAVAAE